MIFIPFMHICVSKCSFLFMANSIKSEINDPLFFICVLRKYNAITSLSFSVLQMISFWCFKMDRIFSHHLPNYYVAFVYVYSYIKKSTWTLFSFLCWFILFKRSTTAITYNFHMFQTGQNSWMLRFLFNHEHFINSIPNIFARRRHGFIKNLPTRLFKESLNDFFSNVNYQHH